MVQTLLDHSKFNGKFVLQEDSRRSVSEHQRGGDIDHYDDEEEDEESDADDFIVDDEGRPITEKKKKVRRIFNDAHLQEGQDIFGVDFDYDEFDKYDEQDYEDESEAEDEYEEDGADGIEREKRPKKAAKKKTARKSIFEIYEPSELKRGHFTDLDNEVNKYKLLYQLPSNQLLLFFCRFVKQTFPNVCNFVKSP